MKALTQIELAVVNGAGDDDSSFGDYLGSVFTGVCTATTGTLTGAAGCAAAGEFLGDWADSVSGDGVATVSDPMDGKLGIGG